MTKKMREFKERLQKNKASTIGQYVRATGEDLKIDLCNQFIDKLAELLGDKYEMVASCNRDLSRYLIPAGTKDQIRDLPVPKARPRNNPDGATKAVRGTQVAVQTEDGTYRCVFGDKYDRTRHRWTWVEADPKEVIALLGL